MWSTNSKTVALMGSQHMQGQDLTPEPLLQNLNYILNEHCIGAKSMAQQVSLHLQVQAHLVRYLSDPLVIAWESSRVWAKPKGICNQVGNPKEAHGPWFFIASSLSTAVGSEPDIWSLEERTSRKKIFPFLCLFLSINLSLKRINKSFSKSIYYA